MPFLLLGNSELTVELDEVDYLYFWMYTWTLRRDGYVVSNAFNGRLLHTIIADRMKMVREEVDHADRNKLNCQRSNLRPATKSQNGMNYVKPIHSSEYRGVTWDESRQKWKASIRVKGRMTFLGRFDDPIEAAKAYDKAAKRFHGEFALLNFEETNAE